jgi:hypothetical protein
MLTVVWRAEDNAILREDEGQAMEVEAQVAAQPVDRLEMRDLLVRAIGAITLIALAFFAMSIA